MSNRQQTGQVSSDPVDFKPSLAMVQLEAEVPEVLHQGLGTFMASQPHWDSSSLLTTALASFLFQNGWADPCVARLYLEGLDRLETSST